MDTPAEQGKRAARAEAAAGHAAEVKFQPPFNYAKSPKPGFNVYDASGNHVCRVYAEGDRGLSLVYLLATAPKLLAALDELINRIDNDMLRKCPDSFPGIPPAIERAKLVSRKARGQC